MNTQSKTAAGSIDGVGGIVELVNMDGQAIASMQLSGTFSGTLEFEGTVNGKNWFSLPFESPVGEEGSSTTSVGVFSGSVSGMKAIRVRASVLASGSVEVIIITTFSGSLPSHESSFVNDPMLTMAAGEKILISRIHNAVAKFGRNPDVDTTSDPEDIWDGGGIYVPPTQTRTHDVASDSAQDAGTLVSSGTATDGSLTTLIDSSATFVSDGVAAGDVLVNDDTDDHSIILSIDSETQVTVRTMHHGNVNASGNTYRIATSAGTGAVFVHITNALDGDWVEQREFVLLNGTTNVATALSHFRINSAHIHGAGSNKTNVGNITITAQTDATVTAQISANIGRTLMAFTTVPAGKTMYVTHYKSTLNRAGAIKDAQMDVSIRIRLWGDYSDGEEVLHYEGTSVNGSPAENEWRSYLKISQMTDFWIRCESVTDSDSDVTAFFDYILVNN